MIKLNILKHNIWYTLPSRSIGTLPFKKNEQKWILKFFFWIIFYSQLCLKMKILRLTIYPCISWSIWGTDYHECAWCWPDTDLTLLLCHSATEAHRKSTLLLCEVMSIKFWLWYQYFIKETEESDCFILTHVSNLISTISMQFTWQLDLIRIGSLMYM